MRVLIFQPGIGPYRLDFFNELAQCCELKIVYFYDHASGQRFPEPLADRLKNCEVEKLDGGWNPRGYYPVRPRLGRVIKEFAPDVVVGYEYNTLALHLALLRRTLPVRWKLLLWSSDNVELASKAAPGRKMARAVCVAAADGLLLYSETVKEYYLRQAALGKPVFVLPNVQSVARQRRECAAALPRAAELAARPELSGRHVVLFVGRLAPEKNLTLLLDAWRLAALSDAALVLVGDGPERDRLKEMLAHSGLKNVVLAGSVYGKELAAYFAAADLLVLPSSFEPFGAVVAEALAVGVPCLLSRHVGARDLVKNPEQGEVLSSDTPDELAGALTRGLASAPSRRDFTALRLALTDHDTGKFVKSFLDFCAAPIPEPASFPRRRALMVLAVLSAVAAALRVLSMLLEPTLSRDGVYYLDLAREWSATGIRPLELSAAAFPLLYIWGVKLLMDMGLSPALAGIGISFAAGVALVAAVYAAARAFALGRGAALAAAALIALAPSAVRYSVLTQRESLYLLAATLTLAAGAAAWRRNSPAKWALFGVLSALTVFCRTEGWELAGLALVLLTGRMVFDSGKRGKALSGLLLFLVAMAATVVLAGLALGFKLGTFPLPFDIGLVKEAL